MEATPKKPRLTQKKPAAASCEQVAEVVDVLGELNASVAEENPFDEVSEVAAQGADKKPPALKKALVKKKTVVKKPAAATQMEGQDGGLGKNATDVAGDPTASSTTAAGEDVEKLSNPYLYKEVLSMSWRLTCVFIDSQYAEHPTQYPFSLSASPSTCSSMY